jgi:hypothetical protein
MSGKTYQDGLIGIAESDNFKGCMRRVTINNQMAQDSLQERWTLLPASKQFQAIQRRLLTSSSLNQINHMRLIRSPSILPLDRFDLKMTRGV